MKAQWKIGLRMIGAVAISTLTGFAQVSTGAQGGMTAPGGATYPRANAPAPNIGSQTQKTAYPGAINYVEGHATLNGEQLPSNAVGSAVVGPNQVVGTTDGYVEVLLTPGAFLRIGHDSEARLISAGLARVDVELTRGSAMVEATDLVKGSTLHFTVNGVPVQMEKKGLYAFDATQRSIKVLDGRADVQQAERMVTLKKGDELSTADGTFKKHDFDMKGEERQPLYVWSKVRSQDESQVNLHAANLIASGGNWYGPGWYWDPFWSSYAFMPGAGLLYSPFGRGFYSPAYYGGLWGPRYGYYARPGFVYGGYLGFSRGSVGAIQAGTGFRSGGGFRGGRR